VKGLLLWNNCNKHRACEPAWQAASLKLANNTTCALELLESMLILSMQVIQGTTRKLSAMAINVAEASPCLCSAKNITGSLSPAGGKLAPEQGRHARIGLVCMLSWKACLIQTTLSSVKFLTLVVGSSCMACSSQARQQPLPNTSKSMK